MLLFKFKFKYKLTLIWIHSFLVNNNNMDAFYCNKSNIFYLLKILIIIT